MQKEQSPSKKKSIIVDTAWIKSAALLFVFLKVVAILIFVLIVIAGLFGGNSRGLRGSGVIALFSGEIFGTITYMEALNLVFLGFISGTIGGMLGMGGGVLKVVNLRYFMGFDILFSRVVSLLSYTVISFSAFLRYRKYDMIVWDIVKLLIPSSILGVFIGVIIGSWINKDIIEMCLGIYALFAGIIVLNQILTKSTERDVKEMSMDDIDESIVSGIGIGMGLLCSLIGISGGVLSTPLQNTLLKLPLRNSIANTIATAVFCSITAATILLVIGLKSGDYLFIDVMFVTLCLIPGNIVGGQLGGYLTKKLQINYVRAAFAVVAFTIGFKILIN